MKTQAYKEKQNLKQMKFFKPILSPTGPKRGRLINENEQERNRIFSASPESSITKLDKIAAAQQRMLARQSGVMDAAQITSLKKMKTSERQTNESVLAEQFLTSQYDAIPTSIRNDPK